MNIKWKSHPYEDAPAARSLSHFFDPENNRLLSVKGVSIPGSFKSPDWILKDGQGSDPQPGDEQQFSYKDARRYFREALTLSEKSEREKKWGKLFQSLGQIIHHVQDMAQPQHVRNDVHCDAAVPCLLPLSFPFFLDVYAPSLFEELTVDDDNLRGSLEEYANGADGDEIYPGAGNANVNVLNTPRKFFIGNGKGIAEFTNRNFVSERTNFSYKNGVAKAHPEYSSPVPVASEGQAYSVEDLFQKIGGPVPPELKNICAISGAASCVMTFYSTQVNDGLSTGTSIVNEKASTLSLFDSALKKYGSPTLTGNNGGDVWSTERVFSLNRFNFDEAYKYLIPRAVSYSAGMINYFFRGELEWEADPDNFGKYRIWNRGDEAIEGTFKLYYDDKDGGRHQVPDAEWTGAIASGAAMENIVIPSIPESLPAPEKRAHYLLVFEGRIGEEENAVTALAVTDQVIRIKKYGRYETASGSNDRGSIHVLQAQLEQPGIKELVQKLENGSMTAENFSVSSNGITASCKSFRQTGIICTHYAGNDGEDYDFLSFHLDGRGRVFCGSEGYWLIPLLTTSVTSPRFSSASQNIVLSYLGREIFRFTVTPVNPTITPSFTPFVYEDVSFSDLSRIDVADAVNAGQSWCSGAP